MSVAWYLPNVVGYIRIILTLIASVMIFICPPIGMILGFLSQILDAADGTLARHLNQCTALGSILDYTTDRMFVACWMIVLTVFYPKLWLIFMLILSLDLMSHLFHMYASMQQGKNSHKEQDQYQSRLLQFYYAHSWFMFLVCLFHDLWISALILNYFYSSFYTKIAVFFFTPFMLFKGYLHLMQLFSSSKSLIHLPQADFSKQ